MDALSEFLKNEVRGPWSDTVILGGGLSGVLLALKLSHAQKKVTLMESLLHLGGRLTGFHSQPLGKSYHEYLWERIFCEETRKSLTLKSGCAQNLYGNSSLQSIERHLCSSLLEEELELLNSICPQNTVYFHFFLMRKELVGLEALRGESSDSFRKKESECVQEILNWFQKECDGTKIKDLPCVQSLAIASQSVVRNFFEALFGTTIWENNSFIFQKYVNDFWMKFGKMYTGYMSSPLSFFSALEYVLLKRGVEILGGVQVNQLEVKSSVCIPYSYQKQNIVREFKQGMITVPLIKQLSFVPREFFTASQVKFALKMLPDTLVFAEYQNTRDLIQESLFEKMFLERMEVIQKSIVVFPVERVFCVISKEDISFYAWLSYEESLQAPAVKDCILRIRRALVRMAKPELESQIKQVVRASFSKQLVQERIILYPVARYHQLQEEVFLETQMRNAKLFTIGDHFHGMDMPWEKIIKAIQTIN